MPAFCFRTVKFGTRFCFVHVRLFGSQRHNTYYSKLTRCESELLGCFCQGRIRDADNLLAEISQKGESSRVVYFTSLVSRYSKSGFVDEARALFDIMPERNVVSYNAMLSGYLRCGRLSEGRQLFEEMPERNVVSWTSMLSGLVDAGRICEARRCFEEMPERNVVSWNAMVNGLVKNGELEDARRVFDKMLVKNVASWNAMIEGYVESGRMEEARGLFEAMGDRNVISWTSMIAGYCRRGEVEEGYHLFCRTPERNIVCWTAMIGGFTWNGFYEEALLLFLEMKRSSDMVPNVQTFISLAYACAGIRFPCLGRQLHTQLIVNGFVCDDYDVRLSKSLIHMYSELGIMDSAHHIFSSSSNGNLIQSYNCMINGYIRTGYLDKAQSLFDAAPYRDKITWTSMINGFFDNGHISKACHLFNRMPEKDSIAWTTMISGHIQNELFAEATFFFLEMRIHGFPPLNATYAALCAAAGATACLDQGRQLHGLMIKTLSDRDLILNNSLISMYAKCGVIQDAFRIFSNMTTRDLISWNSMIMGFSHHGLAEGALEVFEAMLESQIHPNSVTCLGVLSACAHAGLVSRGWELFKAMSDAYFIQPGLEHCISMVHLLGQAGKVNEAEEFILSLPFKRNHAIWGALLGVCWFDDRNTDIAKRTARRLLELDPMNVPANVLLSNVYAGSGQYEEEHRLRKEMGLKGVRKVPGCSWTQNGGRVRVFLSGHEIPAEADQML